MGRLDDIQTNVDVLTIVVVKERILNEEQKVTKISVICHLLFHLLSSPVHPLPEFPSIYSQASLPFLSCYHRTTTIVP